MKTSERITRLADEIEAVLDANAVSSANPQAMDRLRSAAGALGPSDPYTSDKVVDLMGKARDNFQ